MKLFLFRLSVLILVILSCPLIWGENLALPESATVEPGIATPQASDAVPSEYAKLEQQIESLKIENTALSEQEERLSEENDQTAKRIRNYESRAMMLEWGQRFMTPLRFVSPTLANIAFICGAFALLILVIGFPASARKVLSFSFPFSLPLRKSGGTQPLPLSAAAKIVWFLIVLCLLLMLALPAMSQTPAETSTQPNLEASSSTDAPEATPEEQGDAIPAAEEASEGEDASYPDESPAETAGETPATAPSIQPEMSQAVDYINFTHLERALHILDTLQEGKTIRLTLEYEVIQAMIRSAEQHGHLPIVKIPESQGASFTEEVRYGSIGYYFIKASLYEAAGRDTVRELVEQGGALLLANDGAALSSMNMQALATIMRFLASYQSVEQVKKMIPAAIDKVEKLGDIVLILESAHQVKLTEEYQNVVETLFAEQQPYVVVENVARLALKHTQKGAAEFVVNSAVKNPYPELDDNLKVVRLLDEITDKERVKQQLETLAAYENVDQLLVIAQTAAELDLPHTVEWLLVKGVSAAGGADEFTALIAAAGKNGLIPAITGPLAERLSAMPDKMLYRVNALWPAGFDAGWYEEEAVSLGIWTGIQLYQQDQASAKAQELLETTIRLQLATIIDSVGAKPLLALNDMYALVQYYSETGREGLNTAMEMLTLQRHLRGLSDETAAPEDARMLALRMAVDQATADNKRLKESVASLQEKRRDLGREETQALGRLLRLAAEVAAKIFLLLLALWIAFARAVAAARTAPDFRFSHFCLAFTETIGFECCCTVVLILPGAVITLLSQDRLKHMRIMEHVLPPISVVQAQPEQPMPMKDTNNDV